MTRLTFKQVQKIANCRGIILQRRGKRFEYWNRNEGGGVVGESSTLREAVDDFESFQNLGNRIVALSALPGNK